MEKRKKKFKIKKIKKLIKKKNNLTLHLIELEKDQTKPKVSRRKQMLRLEQK